MSDLIREEYKVQLEAFEGPLDLLLYLIRKNEVDIYDIPIGTIATQYMEYLGLMELLDVNVAGDFIVMASTLMVIKSRMLLPVDDRPAEDEEDEDDPRWDLVRQLVEYKKFKDAAEYLEQLEQYQENVFAREGAHLELGPQPDIRLAEVGVFDLVASLNEALARVDHQPMQISAERYTVAEQMVVIMELVQTDAQVSVTTLFRWMDSRQEIVCTFLAMLELIKLNELTVAQDEHFGKIVVHCAEAKDARLPLLSCFTEEDDDRGE